MYWESYYNNHQLNTIIKHYLVYLVSEMTLSQGYLDRLKLYVYLKHNNTFIFLSLIKNQKQRISNVFY